MEVAASGIAVVSLALQLIKSVDTIKTFIRDVKNAPSEITRLSETLESLSGLLNNVHHCAKLQDTHIPLPSPEIYRVLQRFKDHLRPLKNVVKNYSAALQKDSPRRRLWENLKLGLKTKENDGFEERIERDKTALILAMTVINWHNG